jgi:hypothetical protein
VRRAQDEHELLTERAAAERVPFTLVSHTAWRAPGIVVFLPSEEPQGDELAIALARHGEAERLDTVRALVFANALLLQDPWRPSPDLLAMLERNPRRRLDFPELVEPRATVSRLRSTRDDRIMIVERPGAVWPTDPRQWTIGEMNRVDVLDSRLFELPLNLGELGPRATLVRTTREAAEPRATLVVTADLGHQVGDLGVPPAERARLDFTALRELGYSISVPFEFELGLGAAALGRLRGDFPEVELFAANVRAADTSLFVGRRLIGDGAMRLGLVAVVNTTVRDRRSRAVEHGRRRQRIARERSSGDRRHRRGDAGAVGARGNADARRTPRASVRQARGACARGPQRRANRRQCVAGFPARPQLRYLLSGEPSSSTSRHSTTSDESVKSITVALTG